MNMNFFSKCSLLAILCASMLVGQSKAVDLAESAEVMGEVESMSVSAKAAIAEAALGGDTEAIAEAQKRSDAIDAAVAMARDAFASMKLSIESGNIDAAETAEDELAAALNMVADALMGAIPEEMTASDETGSAEQQAAGEPDDSEDPPNIHEVPWKSQGIKAYYQSLFGQWWNASAFGHGNGFGDGDATPQ